MHLGTWRGKALLTGKRGGIFYHNGRGNKAYVPKKNKKQISWNSAPSVHTAAKRKWQGRAYSKYLKRLSEKPGLAERKKMVSRVESLSSVPIQARKFFRKKAGL